MIETGRPHPLGSTSDDDGVNFAIFSERAERVVLCLFDDKRAEYRNFDLVNQSSGIWHGYLPGCQPGQRYGYRVHGHYAWPEGQRFNASKLLIDPFARDLDGSFRWSPAVFDFDRQGEDILRNDADSAPFVPKSVVTREFPVPATGRPAIPWPDMIIYEANVRGYTMRHPEIPESQKGRFRGMSNATILAHLRSLGITSVELMPVQEFIDEAFLVERGLRNFWGYNSINFFVPAGRYAAGDRRAEFRDMVNAIHDAGMEVILDVAYNHTGEGDAFGPTISFRGIDNLCYYRSNAADPGSYVNDTGCGNTFNVDHPQVRHLIVQSLRYWATEMGVDGFRFDLATVLGRNAGGFTKLHPLLQEIDGDAILGNVKLIAEPWDVGPGGYQLGGFPTRWGEWNDRFRDSARRFWRGDSGEAAEFARRTHGSSDLFEVAGKKACASINAVTAHDGFTLADLVSYNQRHNEANGEGNRDGHSHNFSCNNGIEGDTDDPEVIAVRRQQRLNLLTAVLLSQGTPMLLAGDEFGNSQQGNNNAYAQDNDTGWLDWSGLDADPGYFECVRELIQLRRNTPLLRQEIYRHGLNRNVFGWRDVEWLTPGGQPMRQDDWPGASAMTIVLAATSPQDNSDAVAILFNPATHSLSFRLPQPGDEHGWRSALHCFPAKAERRGEDRWELPAQSIACLVHGKLPQIP